MSRRLNTTVHVLGDDGAYHVFGPDDDLPDWAEAKIGDHAFDDAEKAPSKTSRSKATPADSE